MDINNKYINYTGGKKAKITNLAYKYKYKNIFGEKCNSKNNFFLNKFSDLYTDLIFLDSSNESKKFNDEFIELTNITNDEKEKIIESAKHIDLFIEYYNN